VPNNKPSNITDKYVATFESPAGQEVLEHLKKMLGVEDTLEPEEFLNMSKEAEGERDRVSIDPIAMAKRLGQRTVYWKIVAIIRSGKESKDES
jgi:hypothetical protein